MGRIFFSYRRAENPSAIGRIYDRLTGEFGIDSIFYDVETIPIGSDFPAFLDQEVAKCSMMVVIIGKEWHARIPQLHNEADFVRIEIASALKRQIPILPILVDSEIPASQLLPECLQRLPTMNGRKVDIGQDFHYHMNKVISSIKVHLHEATTKEGDIPQETTLAGQHIEPILSMIQDFLENPGRVHGISTGFPELDRITSGLPAGETLVLASQHGKEVSILAQNIVQHLAIDRKKKVFWISTRDNDRSRVLRMMISRSKISDSEIKRGLLSRAMQEALALATREVAKASVELYSAFSATAGQILNQLTKLSRDQVDVILIDDLLSLDGFDTPGMFRKIVTTARQREIPVICVARINKPQKRNFSNPLESIGTGYEIMNEASITALLFLHDVYENAWDEEQVETSSKRSAILRVIKSNSGGLGDIELCFLENLGLFAERIVE